MSYSQKPALLKFRCPHCDQKLSVKAESQGRRCLCPICSTDIRVPEAANEPMPASQEILVKFYCRHCGQKLSCDAREGLQMIRCPSCRKPTSVPSEQDPNSPTTHSSAAESLRSEVVTPEIPLQNETAEAAVKPAEESVSPVPSFGNPKPAEYKEGYGRAVMLDPLAPPNVSDVAMNGISGPHGAVDEPQDGRMPVAGPVERNFRSPAEGEWGRFQGLSSAPEETSVSGFADGEQNGQSGAPGSAERTSPSLPPAPVHPPSNGAENGPGSAGKAVGHQYDRSAPFPGPSLGGKDPEAAGQNAELPRAGDSGPEKVISFEELFEALQDFGFEVGPRPANRELEPDKEGGC